MGERRLAESRTPTLPVHTQARLEKGREIGPQWASPRPVPLDRAAYLTRSHAFELNCGMADWKLGYNYNASYHAYAYGYLYPHGAEQSGNMAGWTDNEVVDLSGYSSAGFYATVAQPPDESPPDSPEVDVVNGHYQAPGQLYHPEQHRTPYSPEGSGRSGSDGVSDSEVHASPESWNSTSSGEGHIQLPDFTSWTRKRHDDEVSSISSSSSGGSPETREIPSSITLAPQTLPPNHDDTVNYTPPQIPVSVPKKKGNTSSKVKARVSFTESQMNTLGQCFSVQRYLTPAEMKNIAELTGLTYKQVKTWFQNRRMKLKRHQRDNGWLSERSMANKDGQVRGTVIASVQNPLQNVNYQGEAKPEQKTHFNQHTMPMAQNVALYLAAMGNTNGPAGYPSWPMGSLQTGVPPKAQTPTWHMAPGLHHFDHNHSAFSTTGHVSEPGKTAESVSSPCV
ncbi:homeobox protein NANOG isoform X1 [Synchiropus splendidus]|uniref:homeobox protein NANOG isoform X1 n=1 Tax=Synchiropus splendidus TaxID=270530 RepID=UPI00237EC04C|nr:homeobox protein NANOG isoform X1 [Synchiropus splendidus]XP_053716871.1 homeobox protein NANOG isoform X1 [Synchiropus splendidus]